jgi:hypothetical protein
LISRRSNKDFAPLNRSVFGGSMRRRCGFGERRK